ncbi:hypothetical protein Glove_22g117 [Diversispora epigaea]|uniref:BTB domain-containing protein n=1 Tax=Diversispora epigaea TaxID=1348612 RepID=A0A397JJJ6_9GLOM|nr:hypothetical protein Glove_22g117 [Diversispora epigaea]
MEEKLWKSISHNYVSLLEDIDTCDVTITVGKGEEIKIFRAHSLILRAQTPYFQTALSIQWGKMKDGKIVLEKPNISPDIFNDILIYIYSSEINFTGKSIHHILGILTAADELILPTLTEHVENFLIKNKTTLIQNHPVEVLKVSFQNEGWKKLQDNCISVICSNPWMLFESPLYYHLDSSIILAILKKDELKMDESEIWYRILLWGISQDELLPDDVTDWTQRDFDSLNRSFQLIYMKIYYGILFYPKDLKKILFFQNDIVIIHTIKLHHQKLWHIELLIRNMQTNQMLSEKLLLDHEFIAKYSSSI